MLNSVQEQASKPCAGALSRPLVSAGYCHRIRSADYRVVCSRPDEPGYQQASSLVREVFHKTYDARCSHFLPLLLSFNTVSGPHGALGMKPATNGSLYLEQYLSKQVEQEISQCFMKPVVRDQVVEIGNLVVRSSGTGQFMLAILGTILKQAGLRYIVFTATPQVQAMMQRLCWPTHAICAADPGRLTDRESHWGRYYETNPVVRVGDIEEASEFLTDPYVRGLISPYSALITRVAQSLRAAVNPIGH